jgi:hypothetical protein
VCIEGGNSAVQVADGVANWFDLVLPDASSSAVAGAADRSCNQRVGGAKGSFFGFSRTGLALVLPSTEFRGFGFTWFDRSNLGVGRTSTWQ